LLIDGLEEVESEAEGQVSCAVVVPGGGASQAFTSSVHVFWLARARGGLGGSEWKAGVGRGAVWCRPPCDDVAGIWRGEFKLSSWQRACAGL